MNARYLGTGFTQQGDAASNQNASFNWGDGFYSGRFELTAQDYQPVQGAGPHFVFSIDAGPITMRPFELSFNAAVNEFSGAGVGQLSAFIYAKRKTTNEMVVVLWAMFDNRFDTYDRYTGNDTTVDFISMPIHEMSATRMEKNTYPLKHYSINITPSRWATFTDIPMEEFDLLLVGFLQEGFFVGGDTITLGAEVNNIKVTPIECDSAIAGDDQPRAFDYIDYFGGKKNAHGRLLSGGVEASWWKINTLTPNSMSICWKNSSIEFFNWTNDIIYQTGWKDQYEYRLEVSKVTLTENGSSTVIATSGPQIYAFRRKTNAYTLETEGTIYQLGTAVAIPYRHVQFYGEPRAEDNGLMSTRQVVPMRETWEDANGTGGIMTLKLDRTVTYALDTGPAYSIQQTYPSLWSAALSEIGDGSAYTCPY